MNNFPFVMSQFMPPPVRDYFVQRSKLNKKLSTVFDYPVTMMYAGAGYGKSTALAMFSCRHHQRICWYSISENDAEILMFFKKIVQSVKQKYPTFGHTISLEHHEFTNYSLTEKIYLLASIFINEVITLKEEIIIILDDFHYVQRSDEVKQWVFMLLDYIPSNLKLVISSRNKPDWEILSTLKVKGELLEIKQEELILSPEEMHFILEDIFRIDIKSDEVQHIFQLTEGWAIAFQMIAQQLSEGRANQDILNRKISTEDLFNYLATEVLNKQPMIIQQFLLQSSILDILTPSACNEILQINHSEKILRKLVAQSLFIDQGEGLVFRFHSLFKDFLENRFKTENKKMFHCLHAKAANYYMKTDNLEAALYHFQKINDYQSIIELVEKFGMDMLRLGRLQNLYKILCSMPNMYKENSPVLYFYQGEIERYHSQYEKAERNYEEIIKLIPDYDDGQYDLLGLAFEGKAKIYLDTIQPGKAERFVMQAIHIRKKANAPKEEMAKLYELMAENLLNLGEAKKASTWLEKAKQFNLPIQESNLQARIYLRTGKLKKARIYLEKKLQQNKQMIHPLPQAHRETVIILSLVHAFMGNMKESKQYAQQGIELGKMIKSPFVEACGWMRLGHAYFLQQTIDGEKSAKRCYETALDIMGKIRITRGKAEPFMGLALLYGVENKYEQAKQYALEGIKETEKVNDRWLSGLLKLTLGLASIYHQKYADAKRIFEDVQLDMIACGDHYGVFISAYWRATLAMFDDEQLFREQIKIFLNHLQMKKYEFFIKRRTIFGPTDLQNMIKMLLNAKQLNIELPYINLLLFELGVTADVKNHPGYSITVKTLGVFKVWIGDKRIDSSSWQREKSKELFALLITYRQKMIAKQEIIQYLWPGERTQTANQKFKVTLNALLKVLEPNRKAREESFFIKRKGSSYGLNPISVINMDYQAFEKLIFQGLKEKDPNEAKELLQDGLKLYQGDFLEDLQLAPWSLRERERWQLLFLRGAEKIAQTNIRLGEFNECIHWCEKIIAIDSTWEEAYRLMMYSYYQKNNRSQALKWYKKCLEVLQRELGVEPLESTKEVYQMIMH